VIEAMRHPPFSTKVTSSAILTWTSSAATWNHYNHDTLQNHAIGKRHRIQLFRVWYISKLASTFSQAAECMQQQHLHPINHSF
jgi:hypothetical protein